MVMYCPVCGNVISPNKGWAARVYDGYCNHCDMPVVDGIPEEESDLETDNSEILAKTYLPELHADTGCNRAFTGKGVLV